MSVHHADVEKGKNFVMEDNMHALAVSLLAHLSISGRRRVRKPNSAQACCTRRDRHQEAFDQKTVMYYGIPRGFMN